MYNDVVPSRFDKRVFKKAYKMTNTIEKITVSIPKCNKDITVDFDSLPDIAKLYYITYGVKQSLNDQTNVKIGSYVSGNTGEKWTPENLFEKVLHRAESIASGVIRMTRGGDQGRAERFINIKWMKALGISKDDMKANASDSNFVISCYVAAVALKRDIDRQDSDAIKPVQDAINIKYDDAVVDQVLVYIEQRKIQEAANSSGLDLDIDLDM